MSNYNESYSVDQIGNIGSQDYISENKQIPHKLIFVEKGTSIADKATALLQATWWTGIKQTTGTYHVSPVINEIAETTSDPVEVEYPNGDKRTISLADYGMDYYSDIPDAVVRRIFTLNNKSLDCWIIWKNGMIEGRSDDFADTEVFYPKRIKELVVVKRTIPDGSTVQRVFFKITYDVKSDFETKTSYVDPVSQSSGAWDPRNEDELDSLRGVNLVASSPGVTQAVVTVKDETGVGVVGLVFGDFTASLGNPSGATDNGGGEYLLTGLTAGSNTFNLVAAASISVTNAFIISNGVSNAVTVTS